MRQFLAGSGNQVSIVKVMALVVILNLLLGVLFYFVERDAQEELTLSDAIWWAMVTMTTVGYGDFYPQTFVGRYFIAYPCFLVGIGLLAFLIGVVADAIFKKISRRRKGLMSVKDSGHIIICNYPNLTRVGRLIEELRAESTHADTKFVLISDTLDELPAELDGKNVQFVKGDPAQRETLEKANILQCEGVVVLPVDPGNPDSDYRSFAIGTIIELIERQEGRPIKTIVEMLNRDNVKIMSRTGVDGIISPDGISARLLVQEYLDPGINEVIEQLITTRQGSQFYLYDTKLMGCKVRDIQVKVIEHTTDQQIVGVFRDGHAIMNPPKNMEIQEGDKLVLLSKSREDFDDIEKEILSKQSA